MVLTQHSQFVNPHTNKPPTPASQRKELVNQPKVSLALWRREGQYDRSDRMLEGDRPLAGSFGARKGEGGVKWETDKRTGVKNRQMDVIQREENGRKGDSRRKKEAGQEVIYRGHWGRHSFSKETKPNIFGNRTRECWAVYTQIYTQAIGLEMLQKSHWSDKLLTWTIIKSNLFYIVKPPNPVH